MVKNDRNMYGVYHTLYMVASKYSTVVGTHMVTYPTARNKEKFKLMTYFCKYLLNVYI